MGIGKDVLLNSAAVDSGTQVEVSDITASNGVLHVINGVLVPPTFDVQEFLAQCRETNPDLDPVAGGTEDKALQGDTDEAEAEDSSSAHNSLISSVVVAAVAAAAAVVTVF